MPTPAPLQFFKAAALKPIYLNCGLVPKDSEMFVARWNDLYVLAKDSENFWVTTEGKVGEWVRFVQNEDGQEVAATDSPEIAPQGARFEWHVQAGNLPEDHCTDEVQNFDRVVPDKTAADLLVIELENSTHQNTVQHFIRVRGPGYYSFKRPTPRPRPAPRPRNSPPSSRRPLSSDGCTLDEFVPVVPVLPVYEHSYTYDTNAPLTSPSTTENHSRRLAEQLAENQRNQGRPARVRR